MSDNKNNHIGTIYKEDDNGNETVQELSQQDFLDLLKKGLSTDKPDPDSRELLKALLKQILATFKDDPKTKADPVSSKTIESLYTIYKYLQQDIPAEKLDKFLEQQIKFMAIPRPAGIEDFLSISATGANAREITIKQFENTKVTYKGRLAIDEQKILEMVRLSFTDSNPYKAKGGLNTLIELPFTQTMQILGRTVTDRNRKEFSRQLRKEMLPNIAHYGIDIKSKDGNFIHMEIGGGYYALNVRKNKIYFKLSDPYAIYLNTGALSQYSSKTLLLGSQKNPLPFYLAIKLQDQYFHDGNRTLHTNNILAVKTVLSFCQDLIPTYDDVQKTDRGHWIKRIREPLENALNEIQSTGLFTWEYCKAGLTEVAPQEISTNDFRKWSTLYITFKLIPEEPNQSERIGHKQLKIEDAQKQKALKEANSIIKADKIQKRNSRRTKKGTE